MHSCTELETLKRFIRFPSTRLASTQLYSIRFEWSQIVLTPRIFGNASFMHLNGNANSDCFPLFPAFQFELFFASPGPGHHPIAGETPQLSRLALPSPKSSKNKSTTGSILTLHCQWSVKFQQKQKNKRPEQSVTRMWVSGAERCDECGSEWCTYRRSPACGAITTNNHHSTFPPNFTWATCVGMFGSWFPCTGKKNQANNYIFSIPLTKTNSKEIGFFIIQKCKQRHLLYIFLCCTISFLSVFLPVLCCCHCTKIVDCKLHSVFPSDVNTGTNGCCRKFCVSIVAKEKQVRVVRLSYTWRPGTWEPRLRPEVRWCRCT